jgi:hypothetical protein
MDRKRWDEMGDDSEHRRPGRQLQHRPRLDSTLCPMHPRCCFWDLACYQMLLREREHWPKAELEACENDLFARLNDRQCPDPAKHRYAVGQVRNLWLEAADE